ncbi:uncharacterized protein LOC126092309 [Schistocerca cancellata]|uniref:uncharacterized protein LOC126092309 n=1 Tax=Schistocerca cancellata TaxID=274614 RepID=UPI0021186FE2|nr:uncharacterized protein LOC126092309 [Schistocerca cancellata]
MLRPARLCACLLPLLLLWPAEAQPPSPQPSPPPSQDAGEAARHGRFLLDWFVGRPPCLGKCPIHVCEIDPAVVHGYCCGCARLFDRVPFSCPGSLTCPLDKTQLCRDYDFMMDCCC